MVMGFLTDVRVQGLTYNEHPIFFLKGLNFFFQFENSISFNGIRLIVQCLDSSISSIVVYKEQRRHPISSDEVW